MQKYDAIIIGAGAAGLFAAAQAGQRGRKVLVLDHARKLCEKIRIAGGGRCNFTNLHTKPENFLSNNPRFCVSALKRFTQRDFIDLVEQYGIAYHEKTLGQLFCDDSSQQIIDLLLGECRKGNVTIQHPVEVKAIDWVEGVYKLETSLGEYHSETLTIATGGKSIPKIGASGFGYQVAEQFGHSLVAPTPALVPLTFDMSEGVNFKEISGVSVEAVVKFGKKQFREGLLCTHRGLSGPSILQISSYWQVGKPIQVDFCPDVNLLDELQGRRQTNARQELLTVLSLYVPKRLAEAVLNFLNISGKMADQSDKKLRKIDETLKRYQVIPTGTQGYAKAEVTLGGVNTKEVSSKTMESQRQAGLYFVGEVLDVTGHLGGFNFQWAWSSGYSAGCVI